MDPGTQMSANPGGRSQEGDGPQPVRKMESSKMKIRNIFWIGLGCLAIQWAAPQAQAGVPPHCDPGFTSDPGDPPPPPEHPGDFTSEPRPTPPPVPLGEGQNAYGPCSPPVPSPEPSPSPVPDESPVPSDEPKDQTPGETGTTVPPASVSLMEGSGKFGCSMGAANSGNFTTLLPLVLTLPYALRRRKK